MFVQQSLPRFSIMEGLKIFFPKSLRPSRHIPRITAIRTKSTIQAGPFRGMRYVSQSHHSALIPKLLGTYERELAPTVEEAISLAFRTVVDIGAAEGYYAVGMAVRLPRARVIAFETEPAAQELLLSLAKLNGVADKLTIRGACTRLSLAADLNSSGRTLVICDTEGGEAMLLDPIRIPRLRACHILVELHDHIIAGISEEIRERFSESHIISQIREEGRSRSDFPFRTFYTTILPGYIDWAVSEQRKCNMTWYWMRPRFQSNRDVLAGAVLRVPYAARQQQ
jgi:hypothetical protein